MDLPHRYTASSDAPGGDEDYDLFNDETFGDVQEDFDWDAATTGPVTEEENEKGDNSKLELTVNNLVIEDEPDDPAIIQVHAKRIPSKPVADDLKNLYGPQSPPAYISTIDNLLDPSHDIWGSPSMSTDTFSGPPDSAREAYLRTLTPEAEVGFTHAPSLPATQPNVETGPPLEMPKNAMTVEELERQQLGSSQAISVPVRGILHSHSTDQMPPLLPVSPHQSVLMGTPPTPPHRFMYSPRHPHESNGLTRSQLAQRNMAAIHAGITDNRVGTAARPVTILQRHPDQSGPVNPPFYQMMGGRGAHPHHSPSPHRPQNMYGGMPPGFGPRPNTLRRGAMPAPVAMNMSAPRGQMQQLRMNMMGAPLYPHPMMYHNMGPPRDEYAGLLTQKERDWLIKIQMLQLHTDDPYSDDYYFMIYNLEKNDRQNCGQRSSGDLIVPALAKVEARQYTPMQFEGSLGRLTSSSVHKPRQVLDVGDKADQSSRTAVETKKYRQSLLLAEKGYQLILELDELKKKLMSIPADQRSEMQMSSEQKLRRLHQIVDENWTLLLNVRKGRSLILRTLPLIDKDSSRHLLERLLEGVPYLVKKELSDPVERKSLTCLESVFRQSDITALLKLSELFRSNLKSLLKTVFGCYLIMQMINQAEKIFSAFVDVTEELTKSWNGFVDDCLINLDSLKDIPKLRLMPLPAYDQLSKRPDSAAVLSKIEGWFSKPT